MVHPPPGAADERAEWTFVVDYPDGAVEFRASDLEGWAEHLTWCMRVLGFKEPGLTVAIDYGTSAVSFLGSSLLMPIEQGLADRTHGSFLCLDASHARVDLVPGVLELLPVNTLIVRADMLRLVIDVCRRSGIQPERRSVKVVMVGEGLELRGGEMEDVDRLLYVDVSVLLAPLCRECGRFHLRAGVYDWRDGEVLNLRQPAVARWRAPSGTIAYSSGCESHPRDQRLSLPGWAAAARAASS